MLHCRVRRHVCRPAVAVAAAVAAGAGLASRAPAAQIVSFNGDYVASNTNFRRVAAADTVDVGGVIGTPDARSINPFSTTTPLSPVQVVPPAAGYVGPTFYGGYQAINFDSATAPTWSRQQINQSGATDRIGIVTNALGANGGQFASAVVFEKPDFLNGGSSGAVSLAAGDSLSVNIQSFTGGTVRLLVQNGSNYFVSNDTLTAAGALTIDPTTTTFAPYNPSSDLNFDQTQPFTGQTFNDVQGVGYYVESDTIAATAAAGTIAVNFSANATVATPEPAGLGLLGVGALGLLARRRRRA